jgi:hypothetical protein
MWKKKESIHTVDESINYCKSVWRFLKKLKVELQYDPTIPVLDTYLKGLKSAYYTEPRHCYSGIIHNSQIMKSA